MSRLTQTFARLRDNGRGGLVTYLTAGDPDAERSAALMVAVARAGADVLEVGVPFSDPLADGPVIQRASERALAGGMSLRGALEIVRRVRADVDTPIVLFTYANPVVRMDPTVFARTAADAGVDGVLILDYPVEEAEPLRAPLRDAGLDPIFLISPTTSEDRIRKSAALGAGFLYVISRLGVTGVRDRLPEDLGRLIAGMRGPAGRARIRHRASRAGRRSLPGRRRGRRRKCPGQCRRGTHRIVK
jgi:tryptophan synthase alpha chain